MKLLNNNIKIVELTHVPLKQDFQDFHGQSIFTNGTEDNSFIRKNKKEQMDKYLRMNSFIDHMFKKTEKTNPVQPKSSS